MTRTLRAGPLELVPLRERPDLIGAVFAPTIQGAWPEFMRHDPAAELYFGDGHLDHWLDTAFAIRDAEDPGHVVGRAFAVPFVLSEEVERSALPDDGWDGVIRWAHADRVLGRAPNALSALEITLVPSWRGRGVSLAIVRAFAACARARGLAHLVAPVRPTAKSLEPTTGMADYVARCTPDGLPADPWMRVHVRAGGVIEKIAPVSMVVPGTLAQWRAWTGLALDRSGAWSVPGALVPVHVSIEQDHAVYVEPNVWVRHRV
ncbi:MAG TPA: hypothetical protein VD970_16770 [Acetobacteraceae bacterium]|nr:hypothetical protein [Acetobacteraceae bacterium]